MHAVEKSGPNEGQGGSNQTGVKTKKPRRGQVEVLMEGNTTSQVSEWLISIRIIHPSIVS